MNKNVRKDRKKKKGRKDEKNDGNMNWRIGGWKCRDGMDIL